MTEGTRQSIKSQDVANTPLWDVREVSHYLHVSINAVYKMTARNGRVHIPHIRLSGRLRFRQKDIDEWLSLLTVSDLDILRTMRRKATEVRYGEHSSP